MAYSVAISQSALREYDAAMRYIASEYGSPRVMRELASEFDAAVDALERSPLAYPVDWNISNGVGREIRKIRIMSYLLRYEVNEENGTVQAYSFLHGRQDASRRFLTDFNAEF